MASRSGPTILRPRAPVAAEWSLARDPEVHNRHLQDWWEVFQDPTLNSLIITAYQQNPNIRVTGTRVLQRGAASDRRRQHVSPVTAGQRFVRSG